MWWAGATAGWRRRVDLFFPFPLSSPTKYPLAPGGLTSSYFVGEEMGEGGPGTLVTGVGRYNYTRGCAKIPNSKRGAVLAKSGAKGGLQGGQGVR